MNKPLSLFLLLLLSAQALHAQESIPLSEADIELLGLEFTPVVPAERQAGISLPGQVVSSPETMTRGISLYAGVLSHWHHEAGASVRAGEVLATIRSSEILSLQQDYLTSRNELYLAQQRLDRDRQLFDNGIISRQRLQETESVLRSIELQVSGLTQRLAQAGLEEQELAQLVAGDFELGTLSIRAPVAGVLNHRAYTTGEFVPENAVVAELTGGDSPWLSVQVPARLLPFLDVGSQLSIVGSGQSLTLRQRDFSVDPDSQSVEVLAEFDESVSLVPGQLQTVSLHPQSGALFIPADAVVHEGVETLVYVRSAAGVEVRALDLMPVGDGYLATAGVSAGEELLIRGTALVKGIQLGLGSDE